MESFDNLSLFCIFISALHLLLFPSKLTRPDFADKVDVGVKLSISFQINEFGNQSYLNWLINRTANMS